MDHVAVRPTSLDGVTAIIPAYNEAASIEATVRSLQGQSWPVAEFLLIALSLPRGERSREHYAGWDRFVL